MRAEMLLDEMDNYIPNFNIIPKLEIPQLNCENIQAFMLNFPQNCKNTINETLYKIEVEFENNIKDFSELVKNLWQTIKTACKELYKFIIDTYKATIKWFKGEYQKICNLYKKLKNKRITWEQLKNELSKYSDYVLDAFGWYVLVDIIETIWDLIKDIWGISKSTGNNIISYFKGVKEIFKDSNLPVAQKISQFLELIIPILAQLITIVLGIITLSKKEKDNNINNNVFEDPTLEIPDAVKNFNYDNSFLVQYLQKYGTVPQIYKDIFKDDKLSVCPVYNIDNEVFLDERKGYIIEIAKDISDFRFTKSVGEYVNFNDIICYIQNIPVYSIIQGIITDVTEHWMILKTENFDNSSEEILKDFTDNIISNVNNNDFDPIYNKYLDNLHIDELLRDYFFDGIKAVYIADYKNQNLLVNDKDIDNFYNDILDKHKNYTNKHDKDIQSLSDPNKIKQLTEKSLLNTKDDFYKIKMTYFKNLKNLLKNTDIKREYQQKIKNNEYELFDYYLNFYINKDEYKYKDDNKFIVKFFNMIKDFMINRYYIENSADINSLILKFNSLSNEYFNNKNLQYYKYINKNIKDYSYKTVKDFIISDLDINSMVSEDQELMDKIKKISNFFVLIKEIELSIKNKILNINSEKIENIIKHKGSVSEFKKLTISERKRIIEFFDEIIKAFNDYNDIEDELSNYYKRINWPPEKMLFVNNIKYMHYIFDSSLLANSSDKLNLGDIPLEKLSELKENDNFQPDTYRYWVRYCAIATLMNAANPIYWSTGIILPSGPLSLPIILIPITFIKGKCSCLLGIGICGIAIYPFMLFVNMSSDIMSYIIIINMLLEQLLLLIENIKELSKTSIKNMIEPMIKVLDEKIKVLDNDIKLLEDEILTLKSIE